MGIIDGAGWDVSSTLILIEDLNLVGTNLAS